MGIVDYEWEKDEAGNAQSMAGFFCHPRELAKLGLLMAQKGRWKGKQLLSEERVDLLVRPSQSLNKTCGLLWWIEYADVCYTIDQKQLDNLQNKDFSKGFLDTLEQTKGVYHSLDDLFAMFTRVLGKDWKNVLMGELRPRNAKLTRKAYNNRMGFSAKGYLGQWLCVYPEKGLVGLRMIESTEEYDRATDEYSEFNKRVYNLID